jgi:multicomponent Na+:H+ antiporter subunit E
MVHAVGLGISLYAFWLLNSGHFGPLLLSLGLVSVVLVLWICRRMGVLDQEAVPIHMSFGILGYWAWLLKEIYKANIYVAKLILKPDMGLDPHVVRVPMSQRSDLGRVIFANSITLTPGTVSIEFENGDILVHSLDESLAKDVLSGDMDRRVTALEG